MFQNSVVINLKRWLEFRGFPTIGNKNKTFKNGASSGWSPLVGFAGTASTYMTSYTNRITVSHLLTVTMNYTRYRVSNLGMLGLGSACSRPSKNCAVSLLALALQARIQLLAKGEVVKIMENNILFAASSKCQWPHATKTSSATSSYEL